LSSLVLLVSYHTRENSKMLSAWNELLRYRSQYWECDRHHEVTM